MSSLADKLRARKAAKNKAVVQSTNTVPELRINVPTTKDIKKESGLSNLSMQISIQNDKLQQHIEQQESKGVYAFSDKIKEIEELDADVFINNMKMLDQATVEKTPDIRSLLINIRTNLQQYAELTHILTDDQLGIIVKGALCQANVETAPKSAAGKNKKMQQEIAEFVSGETALSDLGF